MKTKKIDPNINYKDTKTHCLQTLQNNHNSTYKAKKITLSYQLTMSPKNLDHTHIPPNQESTPRLSLKDLIHKKNHPTLNVSNLIELVTNTHYTKALAESAKLMKSNQHIGPTMTKTLSGSTGFNPNHPQIEQLTTSLGNRLSHLSISFAKNHGIEPKQTLHTKQTLLEVAHKLNEPDSLVTLQELQQQIDQLQQPQNPALMEAQQLIDSLTCLISPTLQAPNEKQQLQIKNAQERLKQNAPELQQSIKNIQPTIKEHYKIQHEKEYSKKIETQVRQLITTKYSQQQQIQKITETLSTIQNQLNNDPTILTNLQLKEKQIDGVQQTLKEPPLKIDPTKYQKQLETILKAFQNLPDNTTRKDLLYNIEILQQAINQPPATVQRGRPSPWQYHENQMVNCFKKMTLEQSNTIQEFIKSNIHDIHRQETKIVEFLLEQKKTQTMDFAYHSLGSSMNEDEQKNIKRLTSKQLLEAYNYVQKGGYSSFKINNITIFPYQLTHIKNLFETAENLIFVMDNLYNTGSSGNSMGK